jgi:hypothetical protein
MDLSPAKVERDSYSMWSSEQIALWRSRQKAYLADRTAVEQDQAIDHQRTHVRQEILQVLNSFLDGGIGLKAFNATFQQRTHGGWSAFYLRGMSGGLFFNQLVQRVPNEETFAHLLRLMIRAPEDRREAQQRMQAFVRFQKVVSKIDVLWLMDQWVIAAYEIEQACTDVSISLLRLYDLKALFPDRQMTLCLVAPQERFEKVQFELSRPAFQMRDIQKHCALISEELLLEQEEHILRWATSPAVIDDLIRHGNGRKP